MVLTVLILYEVYSVLLITYSNSSFDFANLMHVFYKEDDNKSNNKILKSHKIKKYHSILNPSPKPGACSSDGVCLHIGHCMARI